MDPDKIGTSTDLPPLKTLAGWILSAARDHLDDYGYLFSYGELWDILGVDPQEHRGRSAVLKAQRLLLDEHNRYLANVPGKGYEIARPDDFPAHVKALRKASIRKMRKAHRVAVHSEPSKMSPGVLAVFTLEQVKTGVQLSAMIRIESKRKIETVKKQMEEMTPRKIAKAITGAS